MSVAVRHVIIKLGLASCVYILSISVLMRRRVDLTYFPFSSVAGGNQLP